MQLIRLYGRGAKVIHLGKDVIRSRDGEIDVPEQLVASLIAEGWTRAPLNPEPESFDLHKLDAPSVAAIEAGEPIDVSGVPVGPVGFVVTP